MADKYTKPKPQTFLFMVLKWIIWLIDYIVPSFQTRKKATVDEICQLAENKLGKENHSGFGDHPLWRRSLEVYLEDISSQQDNPMARLAVRMETCDQMIKRLRILHTLKQNPSITDVKLPRPIFIVGMPRTGSTILHQIMAQDSRAMSVPYWQWEDPVPPVKGKPDLRLQTAKKSISKLTFCSSELKTIHLTEAHEADECHQGWIDFIFAVRSSFGLIPGLKRSEKLFWNSDLTEMYINQRKILQMLKWQQNPQLEHDWMILKCPLHTIVLQNLYTVFPETTFVWTHRDMKSVVCSVVGLFFVGDIASMPSTIQLDVIGQKSLNLLKRLMSRGLEERKILEENGARFVDFYYNEFMDDTEASLDNLYANLSIDMRENEKQQIFDFYAATLRARKNKKKPIRFTLEDINLTAEEVDSTFVDYYSRFPKVLGRKGKL